MRHVRVCSLRPVMEKSLLALAVVVTSAGLAQAQSTDFGRVLYDRHCAACHGAFGAGDGPVAAHLDPKPADLRHLAGDHDLGFPLGRVWTSISTGSLSAHGTSMMPVWGDVFLEEALPKEVHPGVSAKDLVEARMAALTLYVMSLQE